MSTHFDRNRFLELPSYLDELYKTREPIFIYGMGDGCEKLLKVFDEYRVPCAGIFASDEFVRDKVFMGHRIHSLSEIESSVSEFTVCLAFGAGYKSLRDKIDLLAKRHNLYVPDMPIAGDGLFTREYLKDHFDEISRVYELLSDDKSRICFEKLIEYKLTARVLPLTECESSPDEAMSKVLKLGSDEVYADLGAYTGDTISEFLNAAGGKYKHIYAVEPDFRNFRRLCENTGNLPDVTLINAAIGVSDGEAYVTKGGGRKIKLAENDKSLGKLQKVTVRSLDSILGGNPCSYIKMDVEGAETAALSGAENTIKKYAPKLNIAIYHRVEDILAIPLYIHSLNPKYRLYLRHFPYYPAWDTNIYAV